MKWEEYIKGVLETKTAFDDLSLSSAGEAMSISPIVKASVLMLESELQAGSIHNVFVFPDTQDLVYEFLIAKTVYNITVGKIKYSYDPHLFKKGQKPTLVKTGLKAYMEDDEMLLHIHKTNTKDILENDQNLFFCQKYLIIL